MNLQLENQRALVTASSGGIGLEIARSLAAEGAEVIINGRTKTSVEKAIADLKKDLPDAKLLPLSADNGTAEGCVATISAFPKVDILVNNLGIYEAVGFFEESDEDWQRLFNINIMSGVRLTRHYLRGMLDSNNGRVIFISSESGINPAPEMTHYSATKTMQLSISRSLAELTKGTRVTVNTVMPGPTRTEGVEKFIGGIFPGLSPQEQEKRFIAENRPSSLIQRLIDPMEIAHAVTFLCSPKASAINGTGLRVEGGLVRNIF